MKHKYVSLSIIIPLLIGVLAFVKTVQAQDAIVRAVLFYSPDCDHCTKVINESLPPLKAKYANQIDIVGIDVTTDLGQTLYQSALTSMNVPDDRVGIPSMFIGETILLGSNEIPDNFPTIIEQGLSQGGIDWPNIPGLAEVLEAQPDSPQIQSEQSQSPEILSSYPTWYQNFRKDPIANSIAVIVLTSMLISVFINVYIFLKNDENKAYHHPRWIVLALTIIGLGVAVYLSYIELTQRTAICGPVGDCNSVQESKYATLFGVLPIGILGASGYIVIMIAWFFQYYGPQNLKKLFTLGIWGMTWFGILFSIYLTFLEPFVIGATCAWCITSAIVMTLLFWLSTKPAKDALRIDTDLEDELEDN